MLSFTRIIKFNIIMCLNSMGESNVFKLSFCLVSSNLVGSLTLRLVKGRKREGEGNGGREGRGKGREMITFFLLLVWFVREKWKEI